MRNCVKLIWLSIALASMAAAGAARGQDQADQPPAAAKPPVATPPETAAPPADEPSVQESEVETFYLIDEQGKLVPFYNMPFEEFEKVYKLYKKLNVPEQQRRYVLQQLSVEGTADGGRADLEVEAKILTRTGGWVRVPLELDDLVLRPESAAVHGADESFLEYDANGDGLVCWVQGEPGAVRTIRFQALAATRSVGEKTVLALKAPRATASQLKLRVPARRVQAEVSSGSVLQQVRSLGSGQSELTVVGLAGAFELSWQALVDRPAEPAAPLHVTGNVLVKLVADSHVWCEASLTVQSSRAPFDTFVVRLPPKMELVPAKQPGFTARVLPPPARPHAKQPAGGQLVEVKLDQKTTGPEEVRLTAELRRAPGSKDGAVELGGFEVLGSPFQSGSFNLAVEQGWAVQPTEGTNVRRVESISDDLRRAGVVARFAYDGQPCSLKVSVFRQRKRVLIEPVHLLHVQSDVARLETRLRCKLRGAKTASINIDMSGWEVDDIVPADLIDTQVTRLEENHPLVIQLAPAAALSTDGFELTVYAHCRLDEAAAASHSWKLPVPRAEASTLAPATVAVFPADNVRLTPVADQLVGLAPETSPSLVQDDQGRRPSFSYRETGGTERSVFVAQFEVRKRSIAAAIDVEVQGGARQLQVRQRMRYQVDFEPLWRLVLDAPVPVDSLDQFTITLDNNTLPWELLEPQPSPDGDQPQPESADQPSRQLLDVDLLGNRIGAFELVISYSVPLPAGSGNSPLEVSVPLLLPAGPDEQTVTLAQLQLQAGGSFHLEPQGEDWQAVQLPAPGNGTARRFAYTATELPRRLQLQLNPATESDQALTVVDQLWVQTWLSDVQRRDRAVFRLTTSQQQLQFRLPRGARLEDAAVNGHRSKSVTVVAGTVVVKLPEQRPRRQIVELWYIFPGGRPGRRQQTIELPRLAGARWLQQFYWQLVLPPDEHLLLGPSGLTPELGWRWRGLYWGRQALLTQGDLERRTGASRQDPVPPSCNQYLFSCFGPVSSLRVVTAGRREIMLGVSIIAFVAGLLLIYVPLLRHPIALVGCGVALAGAALFYSELTLQLVQTASLAIALVAAALLLRLTIAQPRVWRAVVRGTSRPSFDSSIGETMITAAERPSQGSTASGLSIRVNEPSSQR